MLFSNFPVPFSDQHSFQLVHQLCCYGQWPTATLEKNISPGDLVIQGKSLKKRRSVEFVVVIKGEKHLNIPISQLDYHSRLRHKYNTGIEDQIESSQHIIFAINCMTGFEHV